MNVNLKTPTLKVNRDFLSYISGGIAKSKADLYNSQFIEALRKGLSNDEFIQKAESKPLIFKVKAKFENPLGYPEDNMWYGFGISITTPVKKIIEKIVKKHIFRPNETKPEEVIKHRILAKENFCCNETSAINKIRKSNNPDALAEFFINRFKSLLEAKKVQSFINKSTTAGIPVIK